MENSRNFGRKVIMFSVGASLVVLAGMYLYGANPNPISVTISGTSGKFVANPPLVPLDIANQESILFVNSSGTDVIVCGFGDAKPADRAFLSTQFYVPNANANPNQAPTGRVRFQAKKGEHDYAVYSADDDCPAETGMVPPKTIIVRLK